MNNKSLLFLITIFLVVSHAFAQAKDIDGHKYKTARIGTQRWMAENLNTSRFRNGDPIPEAKKKSDWDNAGLNKQPMWCYHVNDSGRILGKLYNWYAVIDPRGLAPAGWHVASDSEWTVLYKSLGGDSLACIKMRAIKGWSSLYKGTNASGFSALPNDERANGGSFSTNMGRMASWWTSSAKAPGYSDNWARACYRVLFDNASTFKGTLVNRNHGLYVRCIKDQDN